MARHRSMLQRFMDYFKCSPPVTALKSTEREATAFSVDGKDVVVKRKPGGWKCMPFIIGNETFERVATFGLTVNFTVYLVNHLRMKQVAAANAANIFGGTAMFAPLIGAFISDAYWGRYRTLAYASVSTFLGMIIMTLTAAVPALQPPPCKVPAPRNSATPAAVALNQCEGPSTSLIGVLILALALLTVGAGGVRPCSLPFGVDQFDATTTTGRRELISFFNWYYATTSFGIMMALTVIVYVQDQISWTIGFAVPTALMLCAIILFFAGTKFYVHVAPEGSVFSGIVQVFVAAYKKRNIELPSPEDPRQQELQLYNPGVKNERVMKLPLTLQFKWLNKAAIIQREDEVLPEGSPADRWLLAGVQQIEEVKCLLRIVPLWASGVICFVAVGQQWTFGVLQSMTMDRKLPPGTESFEIPPTSLVATSMLVLTLFIPIYDKLFVPAARKFTGIDSGITLLQRQGVGLFLSSVTMVVAGLFEAKRRSSAIAHGGFSTPMSALWLTPQLGIAGIAEAFNAVGQIEFYNKQFPEHMQTIANALFCLSIAFAGYISSAVIAAVRRNTGWLNDNITAGRLDYYYYMLAVFGIVNLVYFVVCAHFYRYKGTPEVPIGDGDGGDEKVDGTAVP